MKPPAPVALPDPSHSPQLAVDLQVTALLDNDRPEPDSGLATIHAFLVPGRPEYPDFVRDRGPRLRALFHPDDVYTLRSERTGDYSAQVTLEIQRQGAPRVVFTMAHLYPLPTFPGIPDQPCWITHDIDFYETG